ncbi:MAG: hypothetical protein ACRD3V_19920 [Vicinamibacteria bacterium]
MTRGSPEGSGSTEAASVADEKPAGFEFEAGQFLNYTLIDPPGTDAEGNLRSFSIGSAPGGRT